MKINEKNLYTFANSKPVDKEGFLNFKRDQKFHKRWMVLKGNMLFYFEKKADKEPLGLLLLEGCTVELSAEEESQQYCFKLVFLTPGEVRSYFLAAETQDKMESWMKQITCASYDYMKLMISELQRQLEEIDSRNKNQTLKNDQTIPPKAPPRRQNPFNKPTSSSTLATTAELTSTTKTHLETIKDDLIFEDMHQEIGKRVDKQDESGTDKIMTLT